MGVRVEERDRRDRDPRRRASTACARPRPISTAATRAPRCACSPGVLAAQRFATPLIGDASLSRRPMERVARPLRLRGARIEGAARSAARRRDHRAARRSARCPTPHVLSALEYEMPRRERAGEERAPALGPLGRRADLRARAHGLARSHRADAARARRAAHARVGADGRARSRAAGRGELAGVRRAKCPAISRPRRSCIAAAQLVPGSRVDVRGVGVNPTRTGLLEVLRDMGGRVEIVPRGDAAGRAGRATSAPSSAELAARSHRRRARAARDRRGAGPLRARRAGARDDAPSATPAELRVKESDRIAAMARVLARLRRRVRGAPRRAGDRGRPDEPLSAARRRRAAGDHRIAMTAARARALSPTRRRACATRSASRRASRASWGRCARSARDDRRWST